jgi:predicted CopG family antitoxin
MHRKTQYCVYSLCVPTITVNVDDDLKERMEKHPEINWSEVTRQAIQEKIETLEVMEELTSKSELTESDVQEIADKINESGRTHVDRESA